MRFSLVALLLVGGCAPQAEPVANAPTPMDVPNQPNSTSEATDQDTTEVLTLGAGCFWCTEAVYEQLDGVLDAVSGYMGGHIDDPTYAQICSKKSGHVEVTQITFDRSQISAGSILEWFWQLHDPTSMDRQGADAGPQYRSAVFFHTQEQEAEALRQKAAIDAGGTLMRPIVTVILPAETFWPATDDHQDFFRRNPQQGYCRMVIAPKLKKLNLKH